MMTSGNVSSVLFLVDRWVPGGLQKHVQDLCRELNEQDVCCKIAGWLPAGAQGPPQIEFQGLPLYRPNGRKSFLGFWRSVDALRTALHDSPVDVVHIHSRYMTLVCALAVKGMNAARVYTSHSIFNNLRFLPWYPRDVICLNEAGKRDFLRNRLLPPDTRLSIVPNGIEFDHQAGANFEQMDSSTFAFIGRLEEQKGVHLILRAVAELLDTDIHITIAGDGPSGSSLKLLAEDLGVRDRVEFRGFVETPTHVLDRSCALIMPATNLEGFSYVILESFACHRAVIASDLAVFDETVKHGFSGFRFKCGDHRSLASAMRKAMSQPEQMMMMGNNGFATLELRFSLDQMVSDTVAVYQLAMQRR